MVAVGCRARGIGGPRELAGEWGLKKETKGLGGQAPRVVRRVPNGSAGPDRHPRSPVLPGFRQCRQGLKAVPKGPQLLSKSQRKSQCCPGQRQGLKTRRSDVDPGPRALRRESTRSVRRPGLELTVLRGLGGAGVRRVGETSCQDISPATTGVVEVKSRSDDRVPPGVSGSEAVCFSTAARALRRNEPQTHLPTVW